MNEHINLLDATNSRNYAHILTKLRLLRFIAVGFLFLVATASIMLFLIIAFSPLPRLQQEEERYIQTLNAGEYRMKMDKYFYINSRLKDIATILAKRPDVVASYEIIEKSFTPSVQVNFLDIAENSITVNLSSLSLSDIDHVVDNLSQQAEEDQRFRSLTLSGVSYDERENIYEMVATIELVESGK